MCKTVVRSVLMPLVAKYGESIGLWRENYAGHGLEIQDENFADYIGNSFHEDFNLAGNHCTHMRTAIAKLERENARELDIWIDRKLREYLRLKTVIRERLGENHQHGNSEAILAEA